MFIKLIYLFYLLIESKVTGKRKTTNLKTRSSFQWAHVKLLQQTRVPSPASVRDFLWIPQLARTCCINVQRDIARPALVTPSGTETSLLVHSLKPYGRPGCSSPPSFTRSCRLQTFNFSREWNLYHVIRYEELIIINATSVFRSSVIT